MGRWSEHFMSLLEGTKSKVELIEEVGEDIGWRGRKGRGTRRDYKEEGVGKAKHLMKLKKGKINEVEEGKERMA